MMQNINKDYRDNDSANDSGFLKGELKARAQRVTPEKKLDKDLILEYTNKIAGERKNRSGSQTKEDHVESSGSVLAIFSLLLLKFKSLFSGDSAGSSWDSSHIIKTNYIKNEITAFFDWRAYSQLLIKIIFSMFVPIFLVYVALSLWRYQIFMQRDGVIKEIEDLNLEIAQKERRVNEVKHFQEKLLFVQNKLADHKYWTNVFNFLEDNMLKEVYFLDGIDLDDSGEYQFTAKTKNFATMAAQLEVLRKSDYITEVTADGGKIVKEKRDDAQEESLEFTLNIKLDPKIFQYISKK